MNVILGNNPHIMNINFQVFDIGFLDRKNTAHNSHTLITLRSDHEIDLERLYEKLKIVGGVSDAEGYEYNKNMIFIGTRAPANPQEVIKGVLGLLQQEGLITENDVRKAYLEFDLAPPNRNTGNLTGRDV